MQLGRLGVWAPMDAMTAAEGAAFAQQVEAWGYAALWLPESRGRNVLAHSAWLLANTTELIIAPGIANIYARDPMAMANGQRGLNEQSGGRFLLGIGVSHAPTVTGLRGHTYGKPVATMRSYLREMPAGALSRAGASRKAADDPRCARAPHDGAVGRARRRRASLQCAARAYRRSAPDPRFRQAPLSRSLGIAGNRPGEGALRRPPGAGALSAARQLHQQLASDRLRRRACRWRLRSVYRCQCRLG